MSVIPVQCIGPPVPQCPDTEPRDAATDTVTCWHEQVRSSAGRPSSASSSSPWCTPSPSAPRLLVSSSTPSSQVTVCVLDALLAHAATPIYDASTPAVPLLRRCLHQLTHLCLRAGNVAPLAAGLTLVAILFGCEFPLPLPSESASGSATTAAYHESACNRFPGGLRPRTALY